MNSEIGQDNDNCSIYNEILNGNIRRIKLKITQINFKNSTKYAPKEKKKQDRILGDRLDRICV